MMDAAPDSTSLPILRTMSPSPSASPVLAASRPVPPERSVSMASSASVCSRSSSGSRTSELVNSRRRGYARPQATSFADSARNRDSVMSLGTIAHLQYYFARTGLLDGKGGQLYTGKTRPEGRQSGADGSMRTSRPTPKLRSGSDSTYSSMRSSPDPVLPLEAEASLDGVLVDSPIQEEDSAFSEGDVAGSPMLPPTVSTYNYRQKPIARPPTMAEMRRDLRDALRDATKVLDDAEKEAEKESNAEPAEALSIGGRDGGKEVSVASSEKQGWHEIQGMHILDLMTLAIRAAKIYYTAHERPGRLSTIKTERRIREELLSVMETLKRMAARSFSGGVRAEERGSMRDWIGEVEKLLAEEELQEQQERQDREKWAWMLDGWTGRAREREWTFLKSFDPCDEPLPTWDGPEAASGLPTPFLQAVRNGVRLIQLHNSMVRMSSRAFGQIATFHSDTAKPYRCAENLRFWIKAAELRWEVVLQVDVMGIVYGRDAEVWLQFDRELLRWCAAIRQEFVTEWSEGAASTDTAPAAEPTPLAVAVEPTEESLNLDHHPWHE